MTTVESTITEPMGAMQAKIFYDHLKAFNPDFEEATSDVLDHWTFSANATVSITAVANSGGYCQYTITGHAFQIGDWLTVAGFTGGNTSYNDTVAITAVGANVVTVTTTYVGAIGGDTPTATLTRSSKYKNAGTYSASAWKLTAGSITITNKGAGTSTNSRIPVVAGDPIYVECYIASTGTPGTGDEAYPNLVFYTAAGAGVSFTPTATVKKSTSSTTFTVSYCYGTVPATATEMEVALTYTNTTGATDWKVYFDTVKTLQVLGVAASFSFDLAMDTEHKYSMDSNWPAEIAKGKIKPSAKLGLWSLYTDPFTLFSSLVELTLHIQYTHAPPSVTAKKRVWELTGCVINKFSHKCAANEVSTEDIDVSFCGITLTDSGVF